ncbi:alpha/beta hydrolase [Kribbella sp. NBC_01245]|uniref:alpha/beta fold hydrolase n=1 Tax=Kribbella sp. NBC_01245 TaxID=2903578 RepID=UPI002E2E7B25|nr:alpha/beta hydrolase [Kribbella sp. NBC_01245]
MKSERPGQTLLLIHGLGATGRVWDGWRDLLDTHWPGRWMAPDLPGHGSAPPLSSYSFDSMAAAVAPQLPPGGLVVVGHSLGGVIALALASGRYGVQVDRAIALGVKVAWSDGELAKAAALAERPTAWFDTRAEAAARFLRVSGLEGLVEPDDDQVEHGLSSDGGRWRLAMDPRTFGVGAPDMAGLLRASQAETVLARGELDPMNTDAQLNALHDEVVTFAGLGHNAHVEDPRTVHLTVT